MDRAGFQEVHFPSLLPREPYEQTHRWTEYGDTLFRLQDRKGSDYLLGPTHEEMFTLLVKGEYSSYKDLPLVIYQIQTKFRDEARPRAGILRGREFVMKDSYSFDVDDAGLERSYQRHRDAYITTFDRLGLEFVIVSAMSGAMGGSASEEFLAPTEVGEDSFVRCSACDYAANVEAVTTPVPDALDFADVPAAHAEDTPDTPTIDTLVAVSNERPDLARGDRAWTGADTLKNVVFMVTDPDGTPSPAGHRPARRPRGRHEAARGRAAAERGRTLRGGRLREAPEPGQGLHRPAAAGRERRQRHPVPRRSARRRRAPAGSPARTSRAGTSTTSSPVGTSRPTASSTSPRSATATSARPAAASCGWRAASRSATSSSSAASTPRRST